MGHPAILSVVCERVGITERFPPHGNIMFRLIYTSHPVKMIAISGGKAYERDIPAQY